MSWFSPSTPTWARYIVIAIIFIAVGGNHISKGLETDTVFYYIMSFVEIGIATTFLIWGLREKRKDRYDWQ